MMYFIHEFPDIAVSVFVLRLRGRRCYVLSLESCIVLGKEQSKFVVANTWLFFLLTT